MEVTAGLSLSSVYNHEETKPPSLGYSDEESDTVPDRDDHDDQLLTPTDEPVSFMKRRDTDKTLVAPSAYALTSYPMAMGKKRYSCRKKPAPSSTNEHASTEGTESEDTRSFDFDKFNESSDWYPATSFWERL